MGFKNHMVVLVYLHGLLTRYQVQIINYLCCHLSVFICGIVLHPPEVALPMIVLHLYDFTLLVIALYLPDFALPITA